MAVEDDHAQHTRGRRFHRRGAILHQGVESQRQVAAVDSVHLPDARRFVVGLLARSLVDKDVQFAVEPHNAHGFGVARVRSGVELAGDDDDVLRVELFVHVPEAADAGRHERIPLRDVEAQFVRREAFAVFGHDADDDRVEAGRVIERAAEHEHATGHHVGRVAADRRQRQHRPFARLQRRAAIDAVVRTAAVGLLGIGYVQVERRLRQAGDGRGRGRADQDCRVGRGNRGDYGLRRAGRGDVGARAVRLDVGLIGQLHLLHRQAVERHLGQQLLVVGAERAGGLLVEVLLLGLQQRAADAGDTGAVIAQLAHEVEHQPLRVSQQVDVAVAEAGVADEGRAFAGEHLCPVGPREGRPRLVPPVANVQARLAADGEDQRADEVVVHVIVQLVGIDQVQRLARAAVGEEQPVVEVGVKRDQVEVLFALGLTHKYFPAEVRPTPLVVNERRLLSHAARVQFLGDGCSLVDQEVIAGDERVLRLDGLVAGLIDVDHVDDLVRLLHQAADGELGQVQLTAEGAEGQHGRVIVIGQQVTVLVSGADGRVKGRLIVALVGDKCVVHDPAIRDDLIAADKNDVLQVLVGRDDVIEIVLDGLGDAVGRLRIAQFGGRVFVPGFVCLAQGKFGRRLVGVLHGVEVDDDAVDSRVVGQGFQAVHDRLRARLVIERRQPRPVGQDDRLDAGVGGRLGVVALRLAVVGRQRVGNGNVDVDGEELTNGRFIVRHDTQIVGAGQLVNLVLNALVARGRVIGRAALS